MGVFDVMLTLISLQILFLLLMGIVFCCSCCIVGIRIIQILIRIAREEEEGIMGLIHSGASKQYTEGIIDADNSMCAICLEDYKEGDTIRFLPCTDLHHFHSDCVDEWLTQKKCCPLCKVNIDKPKNQVDTPNVESGNNDLNI